MLLKIKKKVIYPLNIIYQSTIIEIRLILKTKTEK